ncbi:MAG: 5-oxoprolinase (ATP-hydrolyzing) subunit [Thermoanaerobacter sp.]|nr:5-oxoprolinase (ATP-hydrolyzing) subunit [Thermoanaerobacter sp.]
MKYRVDINSDIGESFGVYKIGMDEEIVKYISSANIACGFHAGDPIVMAHSVKLS